MLPLVTVITPTTHRRISFYNSIREIVRKQTYPNIEHLFSWSEKENIGSKRNRLCSDAKGEIIVHCDDDDLYSPTWVEKSVASLWESKAHVVGMNKCYFYNKTNKQCHYYEYLAPETGMMLGATLCYYKEYWNTHKFRDQMIGEDFYFTTECGNSFSHDLIEDFLSLTHEGNTSKRNTASHDFKLVKTLPASIADLIAHS